MKNCGWIVAAMCLAVMSGVGGMAARGEKGADAAEKRAIEPKPHMQLPLGQRAPEILASTTEGKVVTLASLRGKPVVLEFGSITDPWFRARVPAVEKLAEAYGDKAAFVIVYQRESHAADTPDAIEVNAAEGFAVTRPTTQAERVKLAEQAKDRLHIENATLLVDSWSNTSTLRYGGYPNMAFVIDAAGNLQAGYPWMDPKKVQGALDALLAGKPVPEDLRGPVHSRNANTDYSEVAMDMMGYAQGAKLATVLDKMQLTEEQRKAVLPPLLEFLADVRNFRELRGGGPAGGKANAGNNATSQPASGGVKDVSADDLQSAIEKLRASAKKFKDACKANLPEKDAQQLMDVFDQGPARRLFADN